MSKAYTADERQALKSAGKEYPKYEVLNPITGKYEYYFDRASWRAAIDSYNAWKQGKTSDQVAIEKAAADTAKEAEQARLKAEMVSSGKEYVFEFSGALSSKAVTYFSTLVKLLGGKRAYLENENKRLVVVM